MRLAAGPMWMQLAAKLAILQEQDDWMSMKKAQGHLSCRSIQSFRWMHLERLHAFQPCFAQSVHPRGQQLDELGTNAAACWETVEEGQLHHTTTCDCSISRTSGLHRGPNEPVNWGKTARQR